MMETLCNWFEVLTLLALMTSVFWVPAVYVLVR